MINDFGNYFLQLVWLFLPAGFANMTASFSKHIDFLDYPVDFGFKWRAKRIFGDHKTYRGFFFGILAALLCAYLQKHFYQETFYYSFLDYNKINFWILGLLSGFGALLGDLLRSFFKRRMDFPPGSVWFPFDQVDWILGAIIALSFYIDISNDKILIAILLAVLIHPAVNYICYLLRLQKNKF